MARDAAMVEQGPPLIWGGRGPAGRKRGAAGPGRDLEGPSGLVATS